MPRGEYLLEVRAEEIPARMLPAAMQELATGMVEELTGRGIPPTAVESDFTPRRLVLLLQGLPAVEPDQEEKLWGPPVQAAYDAKGQATQALLGFAKRCGVEPQAVQRSAKDKGEYLMVARRRKGRPTPEVLAELVPRLLLGLQWPKTMRWGSGEGPWVRPIHGIVSIFEGAVVPCRLFDVDAGDTTRGHPVLSPEPFRVKSAAEYQTQLRSRGIEGRPQERRRLLAAGMAERARAHGGRLVEDAQLLDKLTAICEIPGVMEGTLAPESLALPREVLITSLRDHQSAFAAEAGDRLLPCFFTVMDRPDDPAGRVRAGNEWVVAARLQDARFFHAEDRKLPLAERGERLNQLGFHERLGSYAEKTERIAALCARLCVELGWQAEKADARDAALLLKADLTTEMVKEFTSLQGIMGGIYAREEGWGEAVWQAVYDQYLPASATDRLPRGRVGVLVGLADRLDTLVGMFGLGLVPSGSKDPLGLRRAAQGVARLVLEGKLAIDLETIALAAASLYGDRLRRSPAEIVADLRAFLYDRMRYLLGLQGFAHDEIAAALAVGGGDLADLAARTAALHTVRGEPRFLAIILAAKRIANILKAAPAAPCGEALFEEEAERALYAALQRLRKDVDEAAAAREYERCLRKIEGLAEALDRFFVDVLVMHEDEAVRRNRLALLAEIQATMLRVAKLTEMVVEK